MSSAWLCKAQARRTRPWLPDPLLCPQASKILSPGNIFLDEEKLHLGAEVPFGSLMGHVESWWGGR